MKEIKKYRESHSWTQAELAKICAVAPSTVAMWESDARKPDIVMLKRLAGIFGCTADDLLVSVSVPELKPE